MTGLAAPAPPPLSPPRVRGQKYEHGIPEHSANWANRFGYLCLLLGWLGLAMAGICGLPLALAWCRSRETRWPGLAWIPFVVLAPATAALFLPVALLASIALGAYAIFNAAQDRTMHVFRHGGSR